MADKIRQLENELWESADLLRAESKLTSNQYCMPVLALIFLRYAYSRFKMVESEIQQNRPKRNGVAKPVTANDFQGKAALFLPKEAQFEFLLNLPENVKGENIKGADGHVINSLGEAINNAMELIEQQSKSLQGVLPKEYSKLSDGLLKELLRIFNNSALDEVGGDVIGRIYEYFLNKFAKNIASDDGVFFTPKSLVKMIVNILEPSRGTLLDPACGSGGMFVQSGDFINAKGMAANQMITFFGQEKVEYNAQLCLMNMAVHGLVANIKSGDAANSFYNDAFNMVGKCDYVMANPPFNVDKVKSETALSAGRLPFGLPGVNKKKEVGNANYLWISYFYSYLKPTGRAGFVMAASATDSSHKDRDIREQLIKTGDVDVMLSVGNNFFYTKSLPCTLWFFDRNKRDEMRDKVLFVDARNYYTVVDRTLNEWSEWQLKNLNAIVWLYRGEIEKYKGLLGEYDKILGTHDYNERVETLTNGIGHLKQEQKEAVEKAEKKEKKKLTAVYDEKIQTLTDLLNVAKEAKWLFEKFGEGKYQDIAGLCKIANRKEIEDKNWSLTPGAYVGVAPQEDDGVDFAERMAEIHAELADLQTEADGLMAKILENYEGLKM